MNHHPKQNLLQVGQKQNLILKNMRKNQRKKRRPGKKRRKRKGKRKRKGRKGRKGRRIPSSWPRPERGGPVARPVRGQGARVGKRLA